MSSDWTREALINLISSYKDQDVLYDSKHKLYYNKQARNKAVQNILKIVQKSRQETTLNDILKKIQTLRTQFGQECSKIDKSRSLGDDLLVHQPKVWWFSKFEWISKFMKARNDPSTPLSAKLEKSTLINDDNEISETHNIYEVITKSNADETELVSSESFEEHIDASPIMKKRRLNTAINNQQSSQQTIEYIINEDTNNENDQQIIEIQQTEHSSLNDNKRKSRAFGKYVSALIRDITDEKIFFEAQVEILNVLEKARIKMNTSKRS